MRKSRLTSPSLLRRRTGFLSERTPINAPTGQAAASPWKRATSARRTFAGGQRGGGVPTATRLSTATLRASRAGRAARADSVSMASSPAPGGTGTGPGTGAAGRATGVGAGRGAVTAAGRGTAVGAGRGAGAAGEPPGDPAAIAPGAAAGARPP